MVLHERVELKNIIENGNKFIPDMIKFCIDKREERFALMRKCISILTAEMVIAELSDILYEWVK